LADGRSLVATYQFAIFFDSLALFERYIAIRAKSVAACDLRKAAAVKQAVITVFDNVFIQIHINEPYLYYNAYA